MGVHLARKWIFQKFIYLLLFYYYVFFLLFLRCSDWGWKYYDLLFQVWVDSIQNLGILNSKDLFVNVKSTFNWIYSPNNSNLSIFKKKKRKYFNYQKIIKNKKRKNQLFVFYHHFWYKDEKRLELDISMKGDYLDIQEESPSRFPLPIHIESYLWK